VITTLKSDASIHRAKASTDWGILHLMSGIPDIPALTPNDVHVWMFPTDISADQCAELRKILSPEECARADRFMFESDRFRFIASHAELRIRLGAYCATPPETLAFGAADHGKPFLLEPSIPIQFNLSHSGTRAALIVTPGMRCGIDIEKMRSRISDRAISERFFCARENRWLQSLPSGERVRGFFRLWAVKESILKADGKGLSLSLSAVDASDVLSRISPRISLPNGGQALSLWVGELDAGQEYAAALAVEGNAPRIRIL